MTPSLVSSSVCDRKVSTDVKQLELKMHSVLFQTENVHKHIMEMKGKHAGETYANNARKIRMKVRIVEDINHKVRNITSVTTGAR